MVDSSHDGVRARRPAITDNTSRLPRGGTDPDQTQLAYVRSSRSMPVRRQPCEGALGPYVRTFFTTIKGQRLRAAACGGRPHPRQQQPEGVEVLYSRDVRITPRVTSRTG